MRIKLAILEKDASYLNRIVTAFSTKYADKFEVYSFTNCEMALSVVEQVRLDVLLASEAFDVDVTKIPKRCGFAYLVNSMEIDTYKGEMAICKFQKADLIYKEIVGVYSEVVSSFSGLKFGDDECRVIAFMTPCGGVGSSTMAAACATHLASKGKKTLYLNLEKFGSSDSYFHAEGQFDMSDVIFALKSRKANLTMKMESCVKKDPCGVYFYTQSKIALDMLELSADEIIRLISTSKLSGSYDNIILDMDFGMDKDSMKILNEAHSIIWTGDGSELSNQKIVRAYEALLIKEQEIDVSLINRILLTYNKFSNKSGRTTGLEGIKELGGSPRYERATVGQIINQLSQMQIFEEID